MLGCYGSVLGPRCECCVCFFDIERLGEECRGVTVPTYIPICRLRDIIWIFKIGFKFQIKYHFLILGFGVFRTANHTLLNDVSAVRMM
jgi:hypothetical protein